MQNPGLAHFIEVTGLNIVEIISPEATSQRLLQLSDVHDLFFESYTNVLSEIVQFREETNAGSLTRHAWLILDDDNAVGEIIFHTSLTHKIGVMHFVALKEEVRQRLRLGWFNTLIESVALSAQFDLQKHGQELSALIAEIPYEDLSRWERVGFQLLDVGYMEPFHGRSWKRHGEPTFFPMTPVVKVAPLAKQRPLAEIAVSALTAFLIEHYDLEPQHPEVERILNAAKLLEG